MAAHVTHYHLHGGISYPGGARGYGPFGYKVGWPKNDADCECPVDHSLLFGPSRKSCKSHVFEVRDRPVILRGFKFCRGAAAYLEQELRSCGNVEFAPVVDCGRVVRLDAKQTVVKLTCSGRYRLVLCDAHPEDVWVSQAESNMKGCG